MEGQIIMEKKGKLATPEWILEGYDSEKEYMEKRGMKKSKKDEKTFKIRECPKCGSDEVSVVMGKEKKGEWECKKCKWIGKNIKEEELNEDELMKYLDKNNIELPDENEMKKDFRKVIEGEEENE